MSASTTIAESDEESDTESAGQKMKSPLMRYAQKGVSEAIEPENQSKFKPAYAYFVLFTVLITRIMVQWHRKGLTYAYGYTGLGL